MSSDDNVKTVQSVYEAFGRGDIPTVLDALTDDVDWASEAWRHDDGTMVGRPHPARPGWASSSRQFAAADGSGRVHAAR